MARSPSTRKAEPSEVWRPLAASSVRICRILPRAASKIRSAVDETGAVRAGPVLCGEEGELFCAAAGPPRQSIATASSKPRTKRGANTMLRPIMPETAADASARLPAGMGAPRSARKRGEEINGRSSAQHRNASERPLGTGARGQDKAGRHRSPRHECLPVGDLLAPAQIRRIRHFRNVDVVAADSFGVGQSRLGGVAGLLDAALLPYGHVGAQR